MNFLKFLMLLSLVVWLGGIIFFTAVEAPAVRQTVSDRMLGAALISRSLFELHDLGIGCAVVFLGSSMIYMRRTHGEIKTFAFEHLLALLMLAATLISQRAVLPAIALLRAVPANVGSAEQFQRLHTWSVGLEVTTLTLGLILLCKLARRIA